MFFDIATSRYICGDVSSRHGFPSWHSTGRCWVTVPALSCHHCHAHSGHARVH